METSLCEIIADCAVFREKRTDAAYSPARLMSSSSAVRISAKAIMTVWEPAKAVPDFTAGITMVWSAQADIFAFLAGVTSQTFSV